MNSRATNRLQPCAVTALSALTSLGGTLQSHADALVSGRSGLGPAPVVLPFKAYFGGLGDLPELPAAHAYAASRLSRIILAGIDPIRPAVAAAVSRWGASRVGVFLGTSTAGIDRSEWAYERFLNEGAMPPAYDFRHQHSFVAGVELIADALGLEGPGYAISTACSSSAKTFASAQRLINLGIIDAAVVGGADARCQMTIRGFHSLGILNPGPCTPFAEGRQGMNIGEGAGFCLIEREALAGDSDPIWLLAVGESSDAHHMTAPHPEGLGAEAAMLQALTLGGIEPRSVGVINAHGTGTVMNDRAEAKAISRLLGDAVPVVSTKGYTGHLLGAAAGVEAVFAILGLQEGVVPANLRLDAVEPGLSIHLPRAALKAPLNIALSNSFAFGGNNACVAFGRRG